MRAYLKRIKQHGFTEAPHALQGRKSGQTILASCKGVPPEILWHGTGEKYVPAILTEGLRKKKRLYVHLSGDCRTAVAEGSRHGKPVVFQVDGARMYQDGYLFYQSANHVWLTEAVPPQYLHICQQEGREESECSM